MSNLIYKPNDVQTWTNKEIIEKFEEVCLEKVIVEEEFEILEKEKNKRGI